MSPHPLVVRLAGIRQSRELGQRDVADLLGLSPSRVSQQEVGEQSLSVGGLIAWAAALDHALVLRRPGAGAGLWIFDLATLAAELRRLRAATGLSQRRAAAPARLTGTAVGLWERRETVPGIWELTAYLAALGCSLGLEPVPGGGPRRTRPPRVDGHPARSRVGAFSNKSGD